MPNPLSQVYLYKGVPWRKDDENQRLFESTDDALDALNEYRAFSFYNLSYIRDNNGRWALRIDGSADSYIDCNYLSYQNAPYTTRRHFAYITNIEYINDGVTYVYFEEDYFQTWIHDASFSMCFIDRATVSASDDTIGRYLLPEPVNVPFYTWGSIEYHTFPYDWHIYASELPDQLTIGRFNKIINPGDSGNEYSACYRIDGASLSSIQTIIDQFTKAGMLEAIVSVFASIDLTGAQTFSVTRPTSIGSYTPKNNKCLTYPFIYCDVSGPGFEKPYRFEYFQGDNAAFKIDTIVEPNGQCVVSPVFYNGLGINRMPNTSAGDSIAFGGFRQAAWSANAFENSIAQNGPTLALGAFSNIMSMASGTPQGVASGTMGLLQMGANLWKDSLVSETISGTASASNIFFAENVTIMSGVKMPTPEAMRVIDDYFTMYGYNIQQIRNPSGYFRNRDNFTYIRTKDAEIDGPIPRAAMDWLRDRFNNGVRLWYTNDIGNYS